ncbi:MAG: gamma-glutamylcyclotransferase [Methylovulum sp.]|nr:MAG: gamma-glutamylcyclotransferase [Methylovulum sp.]
MSDSRVEFIFVYGSLRKAAAANRYDLLANSCDYFSGGYMHGKLYAVNHYPGAVESARHEDKVFGELYRIVDDTVLTRLDDYEECSDDFPLPHEYLRKPLPIHLRGGASVLAWVYIYNRGIANLRRILIVS